MVSCMRSCKSSATETRISSRANVLPGSRERGEIIPERACCALETYSLILRANVFQAHYRQAWARMAR